MVIPGTIAEVLDALTLQAQLDLRTELRRLRVETDSVYTAVWFVEPPRQVLDYAGDRRLAPTKYPDIDSTVPSHEAFVCKDSTEHAGIVHSVRLGRGMPQLGLLVADPRVNAPGVMDAVEAAGARLEKIIVRAMEPGRKR